MRNRNIGVRNGIVDAEHIKKMGQAIWLYLWLVDHQTNSRGVVLGGKGLTYKEILPGVSKRTVELWMRRLSVGGYIEVKHTIYSRLVISVTKAKKFPQQQLSLHPAESCGHVAQKVAESSPQHLADIGAQSCGVGTVELRTQPLLLKRETSKPEEKEEKSPLVSRQRDIPPTHPFAQIWQEQHGPLPGIIRLTPDRLRNCRLRERQYTPEEFREAVIRCRASPFLYGVNDRGWKANFDFLIRNDRNISRVLEGEFDGEPSNQRDEQLRRELNAGRNYAQEMLERNRVTNRTSCPMPILRQVKELAQKKAL